jgi:site-specific DNA-methyltransferase (adenine-specific)/adenine-specific DNA-methyltransferase
VSKERFDELERDGRIWWGKSGDNRPGIKRFLSEVQEGVVPQTLWFWKDVGSTRNAKQELSQLMAAGASEDLFITPKPTGLIKRILQIATNASDLILDSFAGSGSTAHAVLQLNHEQGSDRHFVLIEIDSAIAKDITAERIKRLVHGYKNTKTEAIAALGGGFRYCVLGEPLFDERGKIREAVKYRDLAHHVYFSETGEPLPKSSVKQFPLLGVLNGRAIYLLFNGVLGDKSANGGNVLTLATLQKLPKHSGPRVVYGTACRISAARLKREAIAFKQIPYEIKVS